MKAAPVAAAKRRLRKIERSSIGALPRCSISDEQRQQDRGDDEAADHQRVVPAGDAAARDPVDEPGQADDEGQRCRRGRGRGRCRGCESSRRTSAAQSAPASASGTLNQKTQCQEIATRAPPSTGPSTRPIAATIVFVPIASPSCSRGKASVTRAGPLAKMKAPPTPCRIRQRISWVPSAAKPAPSEAAAKIDEGADEGGLAAEEVGEAAGGEDQHGRGDHVGEDHPDQFQQAGPERPLEVRQGDDQRPRVGRHQQHPEAGAGERPPLVVLVVGVDPRAPANLFLTFTSNTLASRARLLYASIAG